MRYRISNYAVLDLAKTAANAINVYLKQRDRQQMVSALNKISRANDTDKVNPLILNYRAILEDLLGQYDQSIEHLNQQFTLEKLDDENIFAEIKVNIGVVRYHKLRLDIALYGPTNNIEKEIDEILTEIFPDATFPRRILADRKKAIWFAHRESLFARLLALCCIPQKPDDASSQNAEKLKQISEYYENSLHRAQRVLALNPPKFLTKQEEDGWKQAMALARNARGRAEMYYTDYFCRPADKLKRLQSTLKDLEWAENKFESEITYKCDVASCHMRLGYWWARSEARDILYNMNSEPNFEPESPEAVASDAEFKMAEEQLKELLEQSLSGYGFGEFELSRAYRLQERFDEAIQRLEKAHDIGEEERDISDARITREIALARARSTTYR